MTNPYQMNCPHFPDGWCIACVDWENKKHKKELQRKTLQIEELEKRVKELEQKLQWQPIDTAPRDGEWFYTLLELERSPGNRVRYKGMAFYWKNGEYVTNGAGRAVAWLPSPPVNEEEVK